MIDQEMNLNIRYDLPAEVWENSIPKIYESTNGWMGFGKGGIYGELGIPYWFSFNESEKHVSASVEPSGLHFTGLMEDEEWVQWKIQIKEIATKVLGFVVGEKELGEV